MTTILPVADMERARRFYRDVLELMEVGRSAEGKYLFGSHAGGLLSLMPVAVPPRSDHTAASFEVEDVAAAVRALSARGVVFEDYNLPALKTVDKVCVLGAERAAWFRDPDGNVLCIHEALPAGVGAPPLAASRPG